MTRKYCAETINALLYMIANPEALVTDVAKRFGISLRNLQKARSKTGMPKKPSGRPRKLD